LLENRSDSKDWKLGIKFEFTASDMPQQNSIAEVAFCGTIQECPKRIQDSHLNVGHEEKGQWCISCMNECQRV
jgi:hypothetical protein